MFIGIDIGASFIKGAVFDLDELTISHITKYPSPSPLMASKNGVTRFETECELYEKPVRKLISKFLSINGNIEGIVFSTQMHGMVFVDPQLKPLTPFIGWQDERILEQATEKQRWLDILLEKLNNIDISNTGISFRPGIMGNTLFWLKENGFLKKHPDSKALFLGDYIAAKLTNGKILVDSTNACGSGLFNTKDNIWDKSILKALGLKKDFLPEVVPSGTKTGDFPHNGKKIPVYVSVGDLQAAVLGSLIGTGNKREICINIGTGSQVAFISDTFKKGNYDIRSYFDNKYLTAVIFIPAGRALNVLIRFVEEIGEKIFDKKAGIWEKLTKLLENKKHSNGLKAGVYYYTNSISELNTGSFTDISENNWNIENMFFSVLENMADNYWTAYKRLGKPSKRDKIICSGGLARKLSILRKLIEKRFKRKISLAPFEEETLAGLFILSLVCKGKFTSFKKASEYVKKTSLKFIP